MKPFVLLLVVLLFVPATARAAAPDDVAAVFLQILLRDDPAVTAERVISSEQSPGLLSDLRDLTDRHDCIVVARQQWTVVSESENEVTLRMELDGTAMLKGTPRRVVPLFRQWHIDAKHDGGRWKIARAQTEKRRIAESMIAAPSVREADAILDGATHVDRIETIELYADTLRLANNRERLDHALALALATGDPFIEIFARRAQLVVANNTPDRAPIRNGLALVEQIARDHEQPGVRLEAWFTIGLLHVFLGEIQEALTAYAAATALVDKVDDPVRAIKAQQMQTWLLEGTGRLTAALQSATRFASLVEQYRWEEGEVVSLFNQGGLHHTLHAYDYARDVFLRTAQLARRRGQRGHEIRALFNAANDEVLLGNYDSAAALIEKTLHDVGPDLQSTMLGAAAKIAIQRGRFAEAEELLRAADATNPKTGEKVGETRLNHAHWSELHLAAGRTKEALEEALLALPADGDWTATMDTALVRVEIVLVAARAFRASGRPGDAIEHLRQTVAMVDETSERMLAGHELSRIGMIDSVRGVYEMLVELLVEEGQSAEALRVAERMRARGLRELIARGHIDVSASMSAEERAQEDALNQRVVELNRTLAQRVAGDAGDELRAKIFVARRELDAFRAKMRVKHPMVARRRVTGDESIELPQSWKDVTVVEYVVAEKQTIAFVVTRDSGVRALRLPVSRKEVVRLARRFASEVAGGSLTYRTPAKKLHQLLIAPLGPLLAGQTLCIIPDGELWSVPFHALVDARGVHVIERHAVFYAHSLSLARHAAASGANRGHLLAFGNPTIGDTARGTVASAFRDVTLGSLIDAESEVRSLADMYRSDQSRVYYRDAARETTFKREAPEFRVLHIAAHAIVDDGAPMYSAVVLAAGRNEVEEDGLLEAREVVDLPLSADLAVLSACETARGKVGAGEGVVGLAWAFFAAGCSTTVVSQWKAESRSTSKLMVEFHRRLLAGDSPAAALRTAQIALRRNPKYRHPFFWAPFVAIGAAGRATLQ